MFSPSQRSALIAPIVVSILSYLCLSLLPVTSAQAQRVTGSGTSATETRSLPEFTAVKLVGSIDLRLSQGPQSVQVQADDNLLASLETVVEDSRSGPQLVVRWKRGQSLSTRGKAVVSVVLPTVTSLSSEGSGDIEMQAFSTPALRIALAGAGDVKFRDLDTQDLSVSISGSSDVAGSGKASKLAVRIAGSGDVKLADLKSDEVSVSIAGSGDASVHADKTLDVKVAGSGDISYSGNATVKSSVAGSGRIRKR